MSHSLAIVTKSLAPYRVRFYREVGKSLGRCGWKVTLITAMAAAKDHPWLHLGDTGSSLEIVEVGGGFDDSWFGRLISRFKNLPRDFALPNRRLFQLLDELHPDVVWTHEYSPFCLAAAGWACVKDRVSILSTDIGDHPPDYACSPRGLWFHRMAGFLYQGVIAQTKEATRRSEPAGAPVLFAPHAIDTDEYSPSECRTPARFRFLFTGALDDRKGIKRVVEVCKGLAADGKDFELRVLGSGPFSTWLFEQRQPWLSIGGFVEGERLREEYRNANAYILPTSGDTYAVTVHEAAASGLPLIVGSMAGAVETLIKEGVTGHAIDAMSMEELALRMSGFLDDPEKARTMGLAARELSKLYDVKLLGRRTAEFITIITGESPKFTRP